MLVNIYSLIFPLSKLRLLVDTFCLACLRMSQLKRREKKMDVDAWVQSFLHTMGAIFDDKVGQARGQSALCREGESRDQLLEKGK